MSALGDNITHTIMCSQSRRKKT